MAERKVGYKSPPPAKPERYDALSQTDMKVLYYLDGLADRRGTKTIEVYINDIAAAIGSNRRMVSNAIKRLCEREYLISNPTKINKGGNGANRYTILSPDENRRQKIKLLSDFSGIPFERCVDYVYWLNYHRDKLMKIPAPSVGDVARLAKCPISEAKSLVRGLVGSGILLENRIISL